MRCAAFRDEGVRENRVKVDLRDNEVRVYDSCAGYYTTCHALSAVAEKRAVAKAEAVLDAEVQS
jgi:hypothetical protein